MPPAPARRSGGPAVRRSGARMVKLTGRDLTTFSPPGNARAMVAISDEGRDWNPRAAFVTGACQGRC